MGHAAKETTSFELLARRAETVNGICSSPFLEYAFKTIEYRIMVTINPDGIGARRRHGLDGARPSGAIPSHRSKHPDEGRGADAQSAGQNTAAGQSWLSSSRW